MSRGQVTTKAVLRDPATAIAAGKCVLSRWHRGKAATLVGISVSSFHPSECGFCEYPIEQLMEALREFNGWAGLVEPSTLDEPRPVRQEVEMFLSLPDKDQQTLVARRQGYVEDDDEDDS